MKYMHLKSWDWLSSVRDEAYKKKRNDVRTEP